MTDHEELMRGPAIKMMAAGESWGRTAKRLAVSPAIIADWWLAYERRCGEVGRVQALTEWGAA